MRFNALIMWNS